MDGNRGETSGVQLNRMAGADNIVISGLVYGKSRLMYMMLTERTIPMHAYSHCSLVPLLLIIASCVSSMPADFSMHAAVHEQSEELDRSDFLKEAKQIARDGLPTNPGDAHVIILPGIAGDELVGSTEALSSNLISALAENDKWLQQSVSARIFKWHHIVNPNRTALNLHLLKDEEEKNNALRAWATATVIRDWKSDHPDTELYLVGDSFGARIATLLCDARDERHERLIAKGCFNAILFASAHCTCDEIDEAVLATAKSVNYDDAPSPNPVPRVYQYYTTKMDMLASTAGRTRCTNIPHGHSLAWKKATGLDNKGGHLGCYKPRYCARYLVPLFHKDPKKAKNFWGKDNVALGTLPEGVE